MLMAVKSSRDRNLEDMFIILDELGKGNQGTSYLASYTENNARVVLKKVECKDESDTNNAFREAMQICKLENAYIATFRECFTIWDQSSSSICLCVTMKYHEHGNLSLLLREERRNKRLIEEAVISRWLGQLFEALDYIHGQGHLHGNLRPSNIYLKDDKSICIGDFGLPTVMTDLRSRTRRNADLLLWSAPEVHHGDYTTSSEVWSLGCILLEMLTCDLLDDVEMSRTLALLPTDSDILRLITGNIRKVYSSELTNLMEQMLSHNDQMRPAMKSLMGLPFLYEIFQVTNSTNVDRRKRQRETTLQRPLPNQQGVDAVMAYISKEIKYEFCVRDALLWLEQACRRECKLPIRHIAVVSEAIRENIANVDVCIAGLALLGESIIQANGGVSNLSRPVIDAVIASMKEHPTSYQLQKNGIALLICAAGQQEASEAIGKAGGIEVVLEAMHRFPDNSDLLMAGCNALCAVCGNAKNAKIASAAGAYGLVASTVLKNSKLPAVVEQGAAAIFALCLEEENTSLTDEFDIVYSLLTALRDYPGCTRLVRNICLALSNLIVADEGNGLLFLDCETREKLPKLEGIPLLLDIYQCHKDNVEVVEPIASLINQVVKYDDLVAMAASDRVIAALREMRKCYLKREEIRSACESALSRISAVRK